MVRKAKIKGLKRKKAYYVVVTPSGRRAFSDTFRSKSEALMAIQHAIYGAAASRRNKLRTIKRYVKFRVKKVRR